MPPSFFRVVEITFTAFAVPALLVPVILLMRWSGRRTFAPNHEVSLELKHLVHMHAVLVLLWACVWIAMVLGVPLERGGSAAVAACWIVYIFANLVLAWVLVRFTAAYGSLPHSASADTLFVRLLCTLVAQPLMTAMAFSVLTRVMGLGWQMHVPGLSAVQEGI